MIRLLAATFALVGGESASLDVSTREVSRGEIVEVSCDGLQPRGEADVVVDGLVVAELRSDELGRLEADIVVPGEASTGATMLEVHSWLPSGSQIVLSAPLEVLPERRWTSEDHETVPLLVVGVAAAALAIGSAGLVRRR